LIKKVETQKNEVPISKIKTVAFVGLCDLCNRRRGFE